MRDQSMPARRRAQALEACRSGLRSPGRLCSRGRCYWWMMSTSPTLMDPNLVFPVRSARSGVKLVVPSETVPDAAVQVEVHLEPRRLEVEAVVLAEGVAESGPAHADVHWEGSAGGEVGHLDGRGQGRCGELLVDLELVGRQDRKAEGVNQLGLGADIFLGDVDLASRRRFGPARVDFGAAVGGEDVDDGLDASLG